MGILQPKQDDEPIRIEEVLEVNNEQAINYGDYVFDSDLEDADAGDDEEVIAPRLGIVAEEMRGVRRGQKKSSRGKTTRVPSHFDDACEAPLQYRKNMGARKRQRLDNLRLMASFADPDDICYDARDLLEETITAFTRLLRDESGMRMWNEFIEKDEKEQRRILRRIDEETKLSSQPNSDKVCRGGERKEEDNVKDERMRAYHPAYSAAACFGRMDKRFKKVLLRGRNVPYEFIDNAEVRLREFFAEAPGAIYVESLASRFKRFYLHATSQFLALKSRSTPSDRDGSAGEKTIEVENAKDTFKPPDGSLVQFLASRRRLKRGGRELDDRND